MWYVWSILRRCDGVGGVCCFAEKCGQDASLFACLELVTLYDTLRQLRTRTTPTAVQHTRTHTQSSIIVIVVGVNVCNESVLLLLCRRLTGLLLLLHLSETQLSVHMPIKFKIENTTSSPCTSATGYEYW